MEPGGVGVDGFDVAALHVVVPSTVPREVRALLLAMRKCDMEAVLALSHSESPLGHDIDKEFARRRDALSDGTTERRDRRAAAVRGGCRRPAVTPPRVEGVCARAARCSCGLGVLARVHACVCAWISAASLFVAASNRAVVLE
jgi:hypothetical protein